MRSLVVVAFATACGATAAPAEPDAAAHHTDAASSDGPPVCEDRSSPQTCGASCTACPIGVVGRQLATCDGTSCGLVCVDEAPKCSDNSCSKIQWQFEDGTLQGITPRAPANLVLAVRPHDGSMALAMDVTNLVQVSFTIPLCATGTGDFSTKTLSAKVTFEGTPWTGDQFFVQASAPDPVVGSFIDQQGFPNATKLFTAPMNKASTANNTPTIVFQAGTYGAQFSGTIWFDDIRVD